MAVDGQRYNRQAPSPPRVFLCAAKFHSPLGGLGALAVHPLRSTLRLRNVAIPPVKSGSVV